jgi:hypothetical protein
MTAQIDSIVDAHVHWWDVETNPWYEFIRNVDETGGTDLHRNYLPPDYRRSIGSCARRSPGSAASCCSAQARIGSVSLSAPRGPGASQARLE